MLQSEVNARKKTFNEVITRLCENKTISSEMKQPVFAEPELFITTIIERIDNTKTIFEQNAFLRNMRCRIVGLTNLMEVLTCRKLTGLIDTERTRLLNTLSPEQKNEYFKNCLTQLQEKSTGISDSFDDCDKTFIFENIESVIQLFIEICDSTESNQLKKDALAKALKSDTPLNTLIKEAQTKNSGFLSTPDYFRPIREKIESIPNISRSFLFERGTSTADAANPTTIPAMNSAQSWLTNPL